MKESPANLRPQDYQHVTNCIESFVWACAVPCKLVDTSGEILYEKGPPGVDCDFCEQIAALTGRSRSCDKLHMTSGRDAERFGGRYIYFCETGMAFFSSPVINGGKRTATLIGGPVLIIGKEEYIQEDILYKNGISPQYTEILREKLEPFNTLPSVQLSHLSNLLYIVSTYVSDADRRALIIRDLQASQQQKLGEHIQELKQQGSDTPYPFETERELGKAIAHGEKEVAQRLLNEILGYIMFKNGADLANTRVRLLELLAIISRSAIEGGAEVELLLSLNEKYAKELGRMDNLEELFHCLSGILGRFTDLVFEMVTVRRRDLIGKATTYMNAHYRDRLSLEQIARYVHMSPSHFSKLFKDEMQCTFTNYLNELRVAKSRSLLLSTKLSIIEIAERAGFDDQSYFTKVFKRYAGMTPKKYRDSRGKAVFNDTLEI